MRHIKNDDFQLIQIGLDENLRLKDIASIIEKDDRAVSRHIKKYRVFKTVFKMKTTVLIVGHVKKSKFVENTIVMACANIAHLKSVMNFVQII